MKRLIHPPAKALKKAYLRQSLRRDQIDLFKSGLGRMFERIRTDEHEEHLKNIVSDFLKDTWYKQTNEINTNGRTDICTYFYNTGLNLLKTGSTLCFIAPDNPEVLQLEAELDRLAYAIYGLTDEEIAVVEGKQT